MKQKFGTRLTSLLLCLALVAGLLQGLPVAAKAANNHNSIGLGATWFWGETINLGSGVHFWYKEDIGIEEAYETESQNRDSEVLQPDLSSIASKYYWKFTNCIAADNSFVDLYVNVPKDKEIYLQPIGIKIIGGKGTSNDPFYFEPVYEHKHDDIEFEAWDSNNSLPDTQGNYYLTKDVLLSSTWNVPGGISMINLCLNNHTIYMENNGDVIQINSGCHLNLFDDGSGTITHAYSNGRGVYISGGHFGMYGGTISGNNVLNGNGGGVCIKDILLKKFTGLSPEDILNIVNYLLGLLESAANVDYFALNGTTLTIAPCTPIGTYSVEVRATAQGDDDHKSGSKTASVTVNIDKAESVPAAVVAIHSTYDGSDKPLVSVTGVATGGTMLYASESGGFSESIPTGIEAGTYNVSYMVAGDENHKDFGPMSVQATIAKADASAVAPTALELVYNGSAQALVGAGQTDDGTMEYALGTPEGEAGRIPRPSPPAPMSATTWCGTA